MSKSVKRRCPACKKIKKFRSDNVTCGCQGAHPRLHEPAGGDIVEISLQKLRDKREGKDREIKSLLQTVAVLESENRALLGLADNPPKVFEIGPRMSASKSESAACMVWSDWHIEERVRPEQVGRRNEYTLKTADERFLNLLHGGLSWYRIENQKTAIKQIVLALLGDFITGSIHSDLSEANQLPPAEAIHKAHGMILSGIKFMLANTPRDVSFTVPCASGNHGRMTKEQRIATEAGNSLEYFMYQQLRDHFQDEKRITFVVQPGYHSYVNFFDSFDVRFHHGHEIKYHGGVGGITVSVNRAIAQWNKARPVNLDVFGHHHQRADGGNFVSNGSLIGYNAFAVSIKASFEPPSQTFFLINREYAAKTMVAPIFVDKPRAIEMKVAA
jgi:hypothetical protein